MTAVAPLASLKDEVSTVLDALFTGTQQVRGSDIHLRAGSPPYVRVDGRLTRLSGTVLTPTLIEGLLVATSGRQPARFGMEGFEYSFDYPALGRFRGHAFRESGQWAISFRLVPSVVPTFKDLRLPPAVKLLAEVQPGLTLITGPTGSGKSTTAAALLRQMSTSDTLHVVTVEDPIEYRFEGMTSCFSQREVGRDTASYADALRAAFREDPDVLFIGEIRDAATLDVAIQAAESGTAVISTFHTATSLKTIQRLVSMSLSDDQNHMRSRLADSLRAIISQRLLPRKGTRGRVLCCEIMLNNHSIRDCIRDPSKISLIPAAIERAADQHMQTFDRQLVQLVRDGLVAPEVALACAVAPNDLRRVLNLPGLSP